GIGLTRGMRGARQVRWSVLGNIALGWVLTPAIAAVICFVLLFVVQNVFQQQVYTPVHYQVTASVLGQLEDDGVDVAPLRGLIGEPFENAV
ncbi:MAG: inorganic phosphate transporter, partial [Hydrogenophaga sp.]|uniref:hypothetical protein n=1 Tax=Hydrogenophaga sp. TaxID=1904254 RepID=UPI0016A24EB9